MTRLDVCSQAVKELSTAFLALSHTSGQIDSGQLIVDWIVQWILVDVYLLRVHI